MDNLTTAISVTDQDMCNPVYRSDLIAFAVLVAIEVLWNFLVLWAIFVNRKKLKQNYVYSFVTSVVIANIALGVLMVYTLLTFLLSFERPLTIGNLNGSVNPHIYDPTNSSHVSIMTWWAFRKGLMVGFFLVMSGNVAALIRGISASAYFVGRKATTRNKRRLRIRSTPVGGSSPAHTPKITTFFTRERKPTLMIFLSWFLPFIFTILTFGWNCVEYCGCLPAYYNKQHFCITERDLGKCSNVWSPMTNGHLLLAVIIWLIQSIAIFIMLISTVRKYRNAIKPSPTPVELRSPTDKPEDISNSVDIQQNTDENSNEQHNRIPKPSVGQIERPPMHPTIKLLIALSVMYTVCTAPMMGCFAVDSFVTDRNGVSDVAVTVASVIVFVYCYLCPAFLIAYMPGLRSALVRALLPCACTTTTVVTRVARITTVRNKNNTAVE